LTLAAWLVAMSAAHAQSTVGGIQGTVTDSQTGEALGGVTVVASSPALQFTQAELTDGSGAYLITNLPSGTYEVTFYYSDLQVRRTNIAVSVGKVTPVHVRIETGRAATEVITITERAPAIAHGSMQQGVSLTEEYTRNIPSERSYDQMLGAAAGTQQDKHGTLFSGSGSVENSYILDGANTTGMVTGKVGTLLLNNFLQEIDIITGGYDAEFGRSTGGVVNVVTKSGSNTLRGSVFANVTPLEADRERIPSASDVITAQRTLSYDTDFGFDLGGPIVRDKLWFYVGLAPILKRVKVSRSVNTEVDRRINGHDYATNADGDGNAATSSSVGCEDKPMSCEGDAIPDVDPDTGLPIMEEIPGAGRTYYESTRQLQLVGKLNLALNPEHQGAISVIGSPSQTVRMGGSGPLPPDSTLASGTSAGIQQEDTTWTGDLIGRWTSKFASGKTQIDAVAGWHHYQLDGQAARDRTRKSGVSTDDAPGVVFQRATSVHEVGINPDEDESAEAMAYCRDGDASDLYPDIVNCPLSYYQYNSITLIDNPTEDRFSGKLSVTQRVKAAGYHQIKLGLDGEINQLSRTNGRFGGAVFHSFDFGFGPLWEARRFAKYGSGDDVCGYGGADGVTPIPCDHRATIDMDTKTLAWSAYLQDKWDILPNLRVNAGLRYEQQILKYAEQVQGTTDASTGVKFGETALDLKHLWAPRVGASYDFTKEGRSRVYASFGRFYEAIPLDFNTRLLAGVSEQFDYYPSRDDEVPDTGCGEPRKGGLQGSTDPEGCPESPRSSTDYLFGGSYATSSTIFAPGLKAQHMDELVLGVEYEPLSDLTMGLAYQHRRLGDVIEDVSPNGGATYVVANPGTFDEDEEAALEQQIKELAKTDKAQAEALQQRLDVFRGIRKFDTPRREYHAVQVSAKKRFSKNFFVQGSYTWSRLEGNYAGLYSPDNDQLNPNNNTQYDLPDLLTNRDGPLPNDRPHMLKVDGYYVFDLKAQGTLVTGARLRAQSGVPITAQGASQTFYGPDEQFVLPRSVSGRTDFLTTADLRLAYARKLRDKMELVVSLDLFNVFNQQTQTAVDNTYTQDGVGSIVGGSTEDLKYLKKGDSGELATRKANFGRTEARQLPLAGRFGLTLTF
jgi:hypothetical protein